MDWNSSINGFKSYLKLERSFSPNSVDAYYRDVNKLWEYIRIKGIEVGPTKIQSEHLEDFIFWLNDLGLEAKSQARILSGMKAFYRFLLLEDMMDHDPTQLLEGPRMSRTIPEVLSYEEIQKLLQAVDLSTDHGVRNRAMLETLYASGLRVSELINLKITNIYEDIGFIKVIGKNDKERIVPIGEEAIKHINLYKKGVRQHLKKIHPEYENILFLNRYGRRLTRVMVFLVIKDLVKLTDIKKNVSPHTFRHSFATHLIEGGADLKAIQDMLGHESITTTEVYTHLDTEYLRETILTFHPQNIKKKRTD